MQYRIDPKTGNKLSALGFGCMRFPRRGIGIDLDKSDMLVMEAIDKGVNYFDTAYVYGGSEAALGEILHRNKAREKIFLATKLPHRRCARYEDFDEIFNEQLKRLKTNFIDYYLIHNVPGMDAWKPLMELGIDKWIKQKKTDGAIRNIGFSFHGVQSGFMELLDAYPWEFCQIQYNYMDETNQAGLAGLRKAHAKGLPVIVMEPLLGGKLAAGLPKKALKAFADANQAANRAANYAMSPAAYALKWLWNHAEVTVVLSGMNAPSQLADNIKTAEESLAGSMTNEEKEAIGKVKAVFMGSYKVPCTGCNYCMPCPNRVNIPGCFGAYNMSYSNGFVTGLMQYFNATNALNPKGSMRVSNCVKCGVCEEKCPQHVRIVSELANVKKRLEPFWMNAMLKMLNKVVGQGRKMK